MTGSLGSATWSVVVTVEGVVVSGAAVRGSMASRASVSTSLPTGGRVGRETPGRTVADVETLVDTPTAVCSVFDSISGSTGGMVGRSTSAGVGRVVPISPEGMVGSEVYRSLSVTPSKGVVERGGIGEEDGRTEGRVGPPGCSVGGVAIVEVS